MAMPTEQTRSFLMGACSAKMPYCLRSDCAEAVKQAPTGRWYITLGHAAFNSRPNNGFGYSSASAARRAIAARLDR